MEVKKHLNHTIEEILSERPDLFVVKQNISSGLDINLIIDGDESSQYF